MKRITNRPTAPLTPSIRLARHADQPGVRLLAISASDTPFQAFQETWDVCVVASGAADWRYRGVDRTSRPGAVRLKEPGERFRTVRVHEPTAYMIVQFEHSAIGRFLGTSSAPHLRTAELQAAQATTVSRLVRRALDCDTVLERSSTLATLVDTALAPHLERGPRPRPSNFERGALARAFDFLNAHFAEEIPVSSLASLAGMHEVSFVRAFRRVYGVPPHRLQTELRIRSAKRLLDLGARGAEVAARLGFHDQSHLSRHFKNIVGVSPGQYMASLR